MSPIYVLIGASPYGGITRLIQFIARLFLVYLSRRDTFVQETGDSSLHFEDNITREKFCAGNLIWNGYATLCSIWEHLTWSIHVVLPDCVCQYHSYGLFALHHGILHGAISCTDIDCKLWIGYHPSCEVLHGFCLNFWMTFARNACTKYADHVHCDWMNLTQRWYRHTKFVSERESLSKTICIFSAILTDYVFILYGKCRSNCVLLCHCQGSGCDQGWTLTFWSTPQSVGNFENKVLAGINLLTQNITHPDSSNRLHAATECTVAHVTAAEGTLATNSSQCGTDVKLYPACQNSSLSSSPITGSFGAGLATFLVTCSVDRLN